MIRERLELVEVQKEQVFGFLDQPCTDEFISAGKQLVSDDAHQADDEKFRGFPQTHQRADAPCQSAHDLFFDLSAGAAARLRGKAVNRKLRRTGAFFKNCIRSHFFRDLQITLQRLHDRRWLLAPARLPHVDLCHPAHAVAFHKTYDCGLGGFWQGSVQITRRQRPGI